jgi:hypothetical protein
MSDVKYIMSIIKWGNKYYIYFPYIKAKSISDRICTWWGGYNTFDECFELIMTKNEYDELVIDKKLLRKLKIDKILNE